MAMASLEILLRQAGRFSIRYHVGTRTLAFIQQSPYCSSSSSASSEEKEPSKGPSDIRVVSYAPKPKDPDAEEEPRPRAEKDFTPLSQRDSISRPRSREESRFLKDTALPSVSYGVRVAPLPEDTVVSREEEKKEDRVTEVSEEQENVVEAPSMGQGGFLGFEARRLQAHMFAREEEARIPFPKLVPFEEKEAKVTYDLNDAIRQVKRHVKCKFDETVEAHVRLSVNPKRSDQMVRGGTALPHGIGKPIKVAVFADGEAANEARAAGADVVGGDELVNEIKEAGLKGEFDKCIATPAFMPRLGKIGKILGPRGLMPNPKSGTVTNDVAEAIREAKKGRIDFKMDKTAIVHAGLGKASFKEEALRENIAAFLNALLAAKPAGLKKSSRYAGFVKTFTLTSTMGPGFRVSIQSLTNIVDQYQKLRV